MKPKRRGHKAEQPPSSSDSSPDRGEQTQSTPPPPQTFQPTDPYTVRHLQTATSPRPRKGQGRRSQSRSERRGHYVRAMHPTGTITDLALDATLLAAAPHQVARRRVRPLAEVAEGVDATEGASTPSEGDWHPSERTATPLALRSWDLRVKERRRRIGNLILFVVDASGSMAAKRRMAAVKGAVLSLLLDAYQKRDKVGLIAFRGKRAELLLPPTNSVELAERALRQMPTGGRTPLAHALMLADNTLRKAMRGNEELIPLLVLVSDGRGNVPLTSNPRQDTQQAAASLAKRRVASLVLDSSQSFLRLGLARQVAHWLNGDYLKLEALHADTIRKAVQRGIN